MFFNLLKGVVEINPHNKGSFKDQHLRHHLAKQVIFNQTQFFFLLLCRLQNAQFFLVMFYTTAPEVDITLKTL